MTTDRLVAGSVAADPKNMKPSTAAGMNELATDIEAAEPFDESTGPMPKIRIQVEPVVAFPVPVKVPPVPDLYIIQHTLTTDSGHTFWHTSSREFDTLAKAQAEAVRCPNARIIFIPGRPA